MRTPLPATADLVDLVRSGDRTWLARAITLVESRHPDDRRRAGELLTALAPHTGSAGRIGITGVPGVGKSTFIDQFGTNLTAAGHTVAVLAVDPSSSRTGGAILGDKTRMARLSTDPRAYIRPSPAGRSLGGVARATRETIAVVEAAGFDLVLVETVGVGQSETTVADMVDAFVVLMLAGAGDQLQGIKRGVLELADLIAVNKADGDNVHHARVAASDYRNAIRLMTPAGATWVPPVLTCSATANEGLDEIWAQVQRFWQVGRADGSFERRRSEQQLRWMWSMVSDRLMDAFTEDPAVRAVLSDLSAQVRAGTVSASDAAARLLAAGGLTA